MPEVLLVSPQLEYPEAPVSGRSVEAREREWVANIGLVSIASYLEQQGLAVELLDLVGDPEHLEHLCSRVRQGRPRLVGFSSVSCYSYPHIARYCKAIDEIAPSAFLLGGGQHLSALPLTALQEIPELDGVVRGEGELATFEIARRVLAGREVAGVPSTVVRSPDGIVDGRHLPAPRIDLDTLPPLNYRLLPDFKRYCPEIELSRGCAWSCRFCTDPFMFRNRVRAKSAAHFGAELQSIVDAYALPPEELRMFFTCSTFGVRRSEIEELVAELHRRRLYVQWRTETRVDTPTVEYLDQLAGVGMRVLDLGLESGSPEMIERMKKTGGSPHRYLERATRFIRSVHEVSGLHLKTNVVFYAGELARTVAETLDFLLQHREFIDSVSAGPVMMYPGTELADNFDQYARHYGTTCVPGAYWDRVHAYCVNPSLELSFEQLNALAAVISKIMTAARGYYEVKAFGQLPLHTGFDEWRRSMMADADTASWHFSVDPANWRHGTPGRNPLGSLPEYDRSAGPLPDPSVRRDLVASQLSAG